MDISAETTLEQLAVIVCEHLSRRGIEAVLTGGAVVSIYTANEYQSFDLDFITWASNKELKNAMKIIGYKRTKGRYFRHPETTFLVEFPAPPLSIGDRPIRSWNAIKTEMGTLNLLNPTHCAMDRLAAYYHWNDYEALDQALQVAGSRKIDLVEIEDWSTAEGMKEKYDLFLAKLTRC